MIFLNMKRIKVLKKVGRAEGDCGKIVIFAY